MSTVPNYLLEQVRSITKKYKDLEKLTGEHFNIFRVLKVERKEVRTHSAFLKELLNAKGVHNCGAVFLRLFIENAKKNFEAYPAIVNNLVAFDYNNSEAFSEEHIGFISEDGDEGGRIDIVLKDVHKNVIVIENKIDAGDQKQQLIRYNNAYPDAPIFYLTLFSFTPSQLSKKHLVEGKEFVCISYKDDIKNWLESCLKETDNLSLLRETIKQYIYLINYLTKQTNHDKMEEEVIKCFLESKEKYNAAKTIRSSINTFENRIAELGNKEVEEQIKQNYPATIMPLFIFGDYIFKVRISNEANHWHTDIVPFKLKNGTEVFGSANDKPIKKFKNVLKNSGKEIFENKNYTAWFFSDYNFHKLDWEDYVNLNEEKFRKAWATKIIQESQNIIRAFKKEVDITFGNEIRWLVEKE